ncbi:MAG: Ig domain-containing protein, partial [Ilumatobacteraceae bacterium]
MARRLSQQNPSPLSGPTAARVLLVGCLTLFGAFIGTTSNVVRANSSLAWDSGIAGISNRLANVTGVYSSPTGLPTPTLTTTGGTAPVLFSIDPALGAGLSFDTSTGRVSGTPSGAYGPIDHVITATDADGDLIETSVYIHLTTQVELSPSSQRLTMVKDMGFFANTQPIREFAWSGTTLTVTAGYDHFLNVGDVVGLDFR